MNIRAQRVAEQMRKEITDILLREVNDPRTKNRLAASDSLLHGARRRRHGEG